MAKDKDKKKKKGNKETAKKEVTAGKAEVATTATDKPKKAEKKAETKPTESKSKQQERKFTNNTNLPDSAVKHRITGGSTVCEGTQTVDLKEITGTSISMYVNDIHCAVPTILETHYWANTNGQRWPLMLISKEDYEWILANAKHLTDDNHIIAVVDCAVYPTLSYGWKKKELKGLPFPGLDLILERDAEFKVNPTNVHNQTVKMVIREKRAEEAPPPVVEEDDDFIMEDDADDNKEPADGEEEFEFED